jgi:hypothetical protein
MLSASPISPAANFREEFAQNIQRTTEYSVFLYLSTAYVILLTLCLTIAPAPVNIALKASG